MAPLKRLVVDVLKPHDPDLAEFADHLSGVDGVDGVTASLIERDKEVQNVKVTLAGEAVDIEATEAEVERLGGTVHSVDQVSCGERVVEDRPTPQDR